MAFEKSLEERMEDMLTAERELLLSEIKYATMRKMAKMTLPDNDLFR